MKCDLCHKKDIPLYVIVSHIKRMKDYKVCLECSDKLPIIGFRKGKKVYKSMD